MVVKSTNQTKSDVKYTFKRKGGKSIIERRPLFSPDGESLAVIVENTVRVYNIQTGDCVRTLETESHNEELIAIEFPEQEEYNLYGCSIHGCITLWTWENGVVIRETKLDMPKNMKILTFHLISPTDCIVTMGSSAYEFVTLASFAVKTGQLLALYSEIKPEYHRLTKTALGWFAGDRYAAVVDGTQNLYIQNLAKPNVMRQLINYHYIRIIAVGAHNASICIGDALGRVFVIRGNFYDSRVDLGRELLHWHFLPVLSSAFSLHGNYLYSGGLEKVLVKWTMGSIAYKTKEKTFIPRLPGHIRFISTNNTHVAVTLGNNSIVIADGKMRATCTILECGGLSAVMRAVGGALLYSARLGGLLLPAKTGHLQLYSVDRDKVLYNIDITQMNDLPSERFNLIPIDTEVTCAALSPNGKWLATSEYRNDGVNFPEEKLKFWFIVGKGATPLTLNTCVNLSHGGCNVIALEFDTEGETCVSAGTDQKFRVWKRENQSLSKNNQQYFVCVSACYYSSGIGKNLSHDIYNKIKHSDVKTYKDKSYPYMKKIDKNDVILKLFNLHKEHIEVDTKVLNNGMRTDDELAMGGIAISQDGSLIAAWFGCKLTLWDTHLCTLRTTLANPLLRPKGKHVAFGRVDAAHYLVCTTDSCLAVFSLLSLTIKWYVNIKVTALAYDTKYNRMAVTTADNDVIMFNPSSPAPVLTLKQLLHPRTGVFSQITFATFHTTSGEGMKMYMMRNNSEIYYIEPENTGRSKAEAVSWQKPSSKFSALLADTHLSEVQPATAADLEAEYANTSTPVQQITTADAHMLPPVSLLSTAFLQQLSDSQEEEDIEEPQPEETMELDSSDDEDTKPNEPSRNTLGPVLWTPNYEAVKLKKLNKIVKEPFLDLQSTSALFSLPS